MALSKASVVEVWTFTSDTTAGKTYETLRLETGEATCNCPGWTRRSIRSCKHTRYVHQGIATEIAKAHVCYGTTTTTTKTQTPRPGRSFTEELETARAFDVE